MAASEHLRLAHQLAEKFSAFVLGVILTLLVVFGSGGLYEYRLGGPNDTERLINSEHWELVTGATNLPSSAFYLRRPRLRLP